MAPILSEFIASGEALAIKGSLERPISGLVMDSRRVVPGNLFFALPGLRSDEDQTCPQVQQVLQGDIGAARLPGNPGTGPVPRPTRPPPSYPDQRTTSQNQLRPHLRRAA